MFSWRRRRDRTPPHQERPAAPQDDRRRQRKLSPGRPGRLGKCRENSNVIAHREDYHHERQWHADPKAASHIESLGVCAKLHCGIDAFQCHSANGTGAGADLAYLRMHGTGVSGSDCIGFGNRGCGLFGRSGADWILSRIREELGFAFRAAKIDLRSLVCERIRRLGCNPHAAYRVSRRPVVSVHWGIRPRQLSASAHRP